MTMDKSLRVRKGSASTRGVLTRAERITKLKEQERWQDGRSPLGLPKVRVFKMAMKKKKKAKKNVMGASSLLEEEIAEVVVQFVSCNGSDEEEGDVEPAPGKKLTKKQIRR